MFLIQLRSENNQRNPIDSIMNSAGDSRDWENYTHQYKDIEGAKIECELLIQHSQHKARNVRIVEVVCTFDSEIKVKSNSDKY